jgi:hypothetical protein
MESQGDRVNYGRVKRGGGTHGPVSTKIPISDNIEFQKLVRNLAGGQHAQERFAKYLTTLEDNRMKEKSAVKKIQTGSYLPEDLYTQVKHRAVDEKISISVLIEKAVREYLAKSKSEISTNGRNVS